MAKIAKPPQPAARAKTRRGKAPRAAAKTSAGSARSEASRSKAQSPASRSRQTKRRAPDTSALLERLGQAIPDPHVELAFENPWQLLVAVILSAQSTDRTVNLVTPELFRLWPTAAALAAAPQDEVERVIKSTGFFRNKAKAIRGASQMLVERFDGEVPRAMHDLLLVPGVARKTANVVLGAAFALPTGIVTDTHAMRVAARLALTREEAPPKIEADLCRLFPESSWIALSHQLVLHGRHWCTARAPRCTTCALNELCPSRQAPPLGSWQERAAEEASDMQQRSTGFARVRGAGRSQG